MNIVELATVVGGFATGLGALFAIATVSVAALQIREQQRFQAAQLFMQNFSDSTKLLLTLRGRLNAGPNSEGKSELYSDAAMLGHKIASMARLYSYAAKIADEQDIAFLRYELEELKGRLSTAFAAVNRDEELTTVLIFADQVVSKSLARLSDLSPRAS